MSTTDAREKRLLRTLDIDRCFKQVGHNPSRILDIGSGLGMIAAHYHREGYDVVGIDINESYLNSARERYPDVKFVLYDGQNIPFPESSFDTIILNDVLEHISYSDIESVISEAHRVLTREGRMYVSVMNQYQIVEPHKSLPLLTWLPRVFWHPLCKKLTGTDYRNYWPYTRDMLEELLERHQFRYQDMTYVYVWHKFAGKNPIGDPATYHIFRLLRQLGLGSLAFILALKVSILVYLARKSSMD